MKNKKETVNKEFYSRITLCQFILCALLLLAIFILRNDSVRADYERLMSQSYTRDDFTAIASSVRDYFYNESALKAVFAQKEETTTEEVVEKETTEETPEVIEETTEAVGGDDVENNELPSDCSFEKPLLSEAMLKPLENGRYTSYFGYRVNPITNKEGFHTGLDIAAEKGTRIRAVLDGKVEKTGEDERAGKYIYLEHIGGLTTLYCHCSEVLAEKGAVIRQGETIALVGSTGMSTGPHLHFEVIREGVKTDPYPLLENAS